MLRLILCSLLLTATFCLAQNPNACSPEPSLCTPGPNCSPTIGLNLLSYNQGNWNVLLNNNACIIDELVSGVISVPQLTVQQFTCAPGPCTFNTSPIAAGAVPTLAGTGACATITTQAGGSWRGTFKCTGTTGASTVTITPGTTAANGWKCGATDITTGPAAGVQSAFTTGGCTLSFSSVTASDVIIFDAGAF
jgi:hypothetical protein